MSRAFRRGTGVGAGLVLLLALALAITFVPGIGAQDAGDEAPETEEQGPDGHRGLSDEDRACLEEKGVEVPVIERDEDGRPVVPDERPDLSDEEKQARREAAEACGIERPRGRQGPVRFLARLSEDERACLVENGVELPELDEDGRPVVPDERPDLSDEEKQARREAFQAAAETCDVELRCPGGPHGGPGGPGGPPPEDNGGEDSSNEPAFLLA